MNKFSLLYGFIIVSVLLLFSHTTVFAYSCTGIQITRIKDGKEEAASVFSSEDTIKILAITQYAAASENISDFHLRVYQIGDPDPNSGFDFPFGLNTLEAPASSLASASYRVSGYKGNTIICEAIFQVQNYNLRSPAAVTNDGNLQYLTPKSCKGDTGLDTGLGCINIDASGFVSWFLNFAIIFGGGISFLRLLMGAFQLITSTGDPEKLKNGKEILESAFIGLFTIIFSTFLLRLIGFQILVIPGFA